MQCGHLDCVQFAGRNDKREGAVAKLRSHWQKEHKSSPDQVISVIVMIMIAMIVIVILMIVFC